MSKVYVYSTLTNDIFYGPWVAGGGDLPSKPRTVLIRGGANRCDRDNRLWTPKGEVTIITDEELALCEADAVFKMHRQNGFITVTAHDTDPDEVAESMTARSGDAPLTPEVIAKENEAKPEDKQQEVTANVPAAPKRASTRRRRKTS